MVTTINTLLVKPGQIDDFISLQREFVTARCPDGLVGGRMYRDVKGSRAVLISQFESIAAQAKIMQSAELQAHLSRLRNMVESSNPDLYEEAYTYGQFK
jgi:quinol monooxygenase YgiN